MLSLLKTFGKEVARLVHLWNFLSVELNWEMPYLLNFKARLEDILNWNKKVIDMGAGLERFAWITMGTPTAYDCCFGPITNQLIQKVGIDADSDLLTKYYTAIAKKHW